MQSDPSAEATQLEVTIEHMVWQGRDLVPTGTDVRDEAVSGGSVPSYLQAALGTDCLNCPNLVEK